MATLYTDRYKRTNLDNRCMSFNGNAAVADCNFSNFTQDMNGGKTRGRIASCSFSSYFSIANYYTTVKIRAILVSNNSSSNIYSSWVDVRISSSNKIPNAVFNFSNVTPDFLSGVTKIQIECQSYSSSSDLYYRGNSSYPQYLTIQYYAEEEILPSTPTITNITYNTIDGKLPITSRHSAIINIGAPVWGGVGDESSLEKKYEILIKDGNIVLINDELDSSINSYTYDSSNLAEITTSKTLTVQIRSKNTYGYSSYSSSSSINFYGLSLFAPTINGNSTTQNPFTDTSGQKLSYNSNYSAMFSNQKEFYFDWSILSTKFSYTNRGYPTTVELGYTIDGASQTSLSSSFSNNRIKFSASQFLQVFKITKVRIVITVDGGNGTYRYIKESIISNTSIKIGTELNAAIYSSWKTGSSSTRVYDGSFSLTLTNADSIKYVNMTVTFSDNSSYTDSKATLTTNTDGTKKYIFVFKDVVTSKNYIGKTVSNVTISLMDSNSVIQGFKYDNSETIYESYTLKASSIQKTFISSWNSPSNINFVGDYGSKAIYNKGYFTWSCEAESNISIIVKIGSTTISKGTYYPYNGNDKTIYSGFSTGNSNKITLSFTDSTYNIPFSGGETYSITGITKYLNATLKKLSMQTSFNKYSAWDSSGNLLPTEYTFTLPTSVFTPSTSSNITYRITCTANSLMLKVGNGNYTLSSVQYSGYTNSTKIYLKTTSSTSLGNINYSIKIDVIGNSKTLDTLTSSIILTISNNNLPPFDINEINALASNVFKTTDSYYFVPEISEVTIKHKTSGKTIKDGVKFEPAENSKNGIFSLIGGSTTLASHTLTNLNISSYKFVKPYNLSNTDDKKIQLKKIFYTTNNLQSSATTDVLYNSNSIKIGDFYISKPSFNTSAQTPIIINKNTGAITIYIDYNYRLTNEIKTYAISNTNKIYINFLISIYGSQTETTETHTIKIPFGRNTTIINKSINTTFSKDFVSDNTSFNVILIPSIVGFVEGSSTIKTFYSGEESVAYSLNLDTPDFAIRKHRISINRTPATLESPNLSSIEVQAQDANYNYLNFYNHTGVKIGTVQYIYNSETDNYVLIDSDSW